MFNKKTTIVVGAGASSEADLPIGTELKNKIAKKLDFKIDDFGRLGNSGDRTVLDALKEVVSRSQVKANYLDLLVKAAWKIRDAMPLTISIDNFIDAHQGDSEIELCGKLAIVKSILEAEKHSRLFIENSNVNSKIKYQTLENTWFNSFIQLITENCRAEQLEERLSSVELIIFNYDRCIEHFLYHSLQTYYGIDENQAATLVKRIKIYHPYGTVGMLPWYGDTQHSIMFGGDVSGAKLVNLAGQIKTFTEGTDPTFSNVVAIRNSIFEAQIVLFLGFAYHRLNMELIRPSEGKETKLVSHFVTYFGTATKISDSDCNSIQAEIANLVPTKSNSGIYLRNELTCAALFNEYWRSLSLS